ncbi:related to Mitochondrial import inner membrane translocase subunit TIM21 [Hanseniaspora guilliermondii]|uniref:Mitochondrial import inner membrane translocase subunit Tim21 n=1 Tax=Hanseniaspora guilliermondii TaxID=56406 RepID=A0A1L0AX08_9ASCO|nr:related to Mitochondrial import inner membrane translocase subunit TIM21 [Hanseniaspora guilliermondii]
MNRLILNTGLSYKLSSQKRHFLNTHHFLRANNKRCFSISRRNLNSQHESIWTKLGRATSFTFNGVVVTVSVGLFGVVAYLLGKELFSPNGDTMIFNRVVNLIESDETCRKMLECNDYVDPKTGKKHTEKLKALSAGGMDDTWTRNRQISSMRQQGPDGRERYFLRIQVESAKKVGIVFVEAIESEKKFKPDFVLMYLDVNGKRRHYLAKPVNKNIVEQTADGVSKVSSLFGLNWGPKK